MIQLKTGVARTRHHDKSSHGKASRPRLPGPSTAMSQSCSRNLRPPSLRAPVLQLPNRLPSLQSPRHRTNRARPAQHLGQHTLEAMLGMKIPASPSMRKQLRSATDRVAVDREEMRTWTTTRMNKNRQSVASRLLTSLLRRSDPACQSRRPQFLEGVKPLEKVCRQLRACRHRPNGYVLINRKQLNRLHIYTG